MMDACGMQPTEQGFKPRSGISHLNFRKTSTKGSQRCLKTLGIAYAQATPVQKKGSGVKLRPVTSAKADRKSQQDKWFFTEKGQRQWVRMYC